MIATYTARHSMDPEIVATRPQRRRAEGAACGGTGKLRTAAETRGERARARVRGSRSSQQSSAGEAIGERAEVPICTRSRNEQSPRETASSSETWTMEPGLDSCTARSVVTDSGTTVVLWVADRDWGPHCSGAGPCLTGEMVDALADRFFRPGAATTSTTG